MAQAWLNAARDLGIRVEHPFHLRTPDGGTVTTQGVYLPDFGSERGTLLTCRFDAEDVSEAADQTDYYQSAINPRAYEPDRRALYVETLDDWGWFGDEASAPDWFAGGLRKHGVQHNSRLQLTKRSAVLPRSFVSVYTPPHRRPRTFRR